MNGDVKRPKPEKPAPGQESVWDYPRPPDLVRSRETVEVVVGGVVVASSTRTYRVLETSHPPTYYLPEEDFAPGALVRIEGGSFCEWKGRAAYADLVGGEARAEQAAWTYPDPTPGFVDLRGHWAVTPLAVEACFVDGERVQPQEGGFYGGWITSKVVGPFKGIPGSWGW
ncbi:DUF427 domain-containing protein [Nocardioides lentus]|uniref:DUF427 domain-containing protein n=1 Tax=Nocardioides lentus TaxID=338077 RepID=A0ABP5B4J3_9ACTN